MFSSASSSAAVFQFILTFCGISFPNEGSRGHRVVLHRSVSLRQKWFFCTWLKKMLLFHCSPHHHHNASIPHSLFQTVLVEDFNRHSSARRRTWVMERMPTQILSDANLHEVSWLCSGTIHFQPNNAMKKFRFWKIILFQSWSAMYLSRRASACEISSLFNFLLCTLHF